MTAIQPNEGHQAGFAVSRPSLSTRSSGTDLYPFTHPRAHDEQSWNQSLYCLAILAIFFILLFIGVLIFLILGDLLNWF